MPSLTPKQEAFALAFIETGSPTEAYRQAYKVKRMSPKAISVEAQKMLKNPSITLAIEGLRKRVAKKTEITVEYLSQRLLEECEKASDAGHSSAAVSALMGVAKTHGFTGDRPKVEQDSQIIVVTNVPRAQEANVIDLEASAVEQPQAQPKRIARDHEGQYH